MKRLLPFFVLIFLFETVSYAQKMTGVGGELSVLGLKPNVRMWFSKTTGFEVFGGISAQLDDHKPDDPEAGFKYLHAIQYNRTDRTYIGIVGKWKWVDVFDSNRTTSLPVAGILIGKEWYSKRIKRKGFAVELGYQYGVKNYDVQNFNLTTEETFNEFPLILNLRYSFYTKR